MTDFTPPPGATIEPNGLWAQFLTESKSAEKRPALFLDRDGVIVEEVEERYLHTTDGVTIITGSASVIKRANENKIPVVIVTNQGGISQDIYDWPDFVATQDRILEELSRDGARVDAVMASPHHPNGKSPYGHPDHPVRKPNPGMLLHAAEKLTIDLATSWIIGDHATDMMAGQRAGLEGSIHVLTGHGHHDGERELALAVQSETFQVHGGDSIADALSIIPFLK
ncbi:MAG: D-glycero-alpha-D-manno-heptose-1,7-bisphosphate 7-phosphatase [Rhodospirillales bacterium]